MGDYLKRKGDKYPLRIIKTLNNGQTSDNVQQKFVNAW